MPLYAIKKSNFWMLIATFFVLLSSCSIEFFLQLEPCPLCIMQRFCTVVLAFLCLGNIVSENWSKRWWYFSLQAFVIALGVLLAGRQLWLQIFSVDDSSLCMPGFEALMHYFSWDIILKTLFWGSNDCATVAWRLLGMPLSAWALVYFLLMLFLFIWHLLQNLKR